MLSVDRDALLCDLAETYGVYDLRALPVQTLAVLSFGLRSDSRIMMKLAGMTYIPPVVLMASICDNITMFRHNLLASEHDKLPRLYTDAILGKAESSDIRSFRSVDDFMAELERIDNKVRRANDG